MLVEERPDTVYETSSHLIANVAQLVDTDTEDISHNGERKEENNKGKRTSDDYREFLVEEQYWEKVNSCQPKYSNRHRMTPKEMSLYQRSIARSPSFYEFDQSTTLILKMLRDKNIVGDYHNIVGYGKNSVVIHANCCVSNRWSYQPGVAVKVYKLSNNLQRNYTILKKVQNEQNNLEILLKNNRMANLMRLPFVHKCRNVIVTFFIGFGQETAPSIASLPPKYSEKMYTILVKEMKIMYNDFCLVHGRLSTKNILYWCEELRIIGWAHSVTTEHPMALRKLMRDCHFITEFFGERGVSVVTKEELFKDVTGLDAINIKVNRISNRDLWQGHLTNPNKKSESSNCIPTRHCRFK